MSEIESGGRFSIEEQIACIERELALRQLVYPKRVALAKMSQTKADHEIGCMRAVLDTLKRIAP